MGGASGCQETKTREHRDLRERRSELLGRIKMTRKGVNCKRLGKRGKRRVQRRGGEKKIKLG